MPRTPAHVYKSTCTGPHAREHVLTPSTAREVSLALQDIPKVQRRHVMLLTSSGPWVYVADLSTPTELWDVLSYDVLHVKESFSLKPPAQ